MYSTSSGSPEIHNTDIRSPTKGHMLTPKNSTKVASHFFKLIYSSIIYLLIFISGASSTDLLSAIFPDKRPRFATHTFFMCASSSSLCMNSSATPTSLFIGSIGIDLGLVLTLLHMDLLLLVDELWCNTCPPAVSHHS